MHKSLKSTRPRTCARFMGGGNAPLYLNLYETYESTIQKFLILGRFAPYVVIKALKMLGQSAFILKSHDLDCFGESVIRLAMTISSSDSHKFKSRGLDTSLRINATLSMTDRVVVILSLYKRRSIHFSDSRITLDSLTLGESMRLRFTRFAYFELLRQFVESPRNDGVGRFVIARFGNAESWQSTSHTTLKESKCKLKS